MRYRRGAVDSRFEVGDEVCGAVSHWATFHGALDAAAEHARSHLQNRPDKSAVVRIFDRVASKSKRTRGNDVTEIAFDSLESTDPRAVRTAIDACRHFGRMR